MQGGLEALAVDNPHSALVLTPVLKGEHNNNAIMLNLDNKGEMAKKQKNDKPANNSHVVVATRVQPRHHQ